MGDMTRQYEVVLTTKPRILNSIKSRSRYFTDCVASKLLALFSNDLHRLSYSV